MAAVTLLALTRRYSQPGSGKTTLVTAFARQYAQRRTAVHVLVHVVGASPTSTDIRHCLLRMCREMEELVDVPLLPDSVSEYSVVKQAFLRALPTVGAAMQQKHRSLLIVIDAVNQLRRTNNAHSLDWLPTRCAHAWRCCWPARH